MNAKPAKSKLPRPPSEAYCGTCFDCGGAVYVSLVEQGVFEYACQGECSSELVMDEYDRCIIHVDKVIITEQRNTIHLNCPYKLCSYGVGWRCDKKTNASKPKRRRPL